MDQTSAELSLSAIRLERLLLAAPSDRLGEDAVAEARALGPERAGDVVVALIEAELPRPGAGGSAIRAAHLAHALGLARAIPSLARCVEQLVDFHPLRRAAIAALSRLGSRATDALLAAFDRARTREARAAIVEALARTGTDDDRIRAALVRMLDETPVRAARLLAERGEWRAVPDLVQAVDRLARRPVADCVVCAGEDLVALASAVRVLGGRLSEAQHAAIDDVLEHGESSWIPFSDPPEVPIPLPARRRRPRLGRNAPCHCGSGRKYKNCHLEEDERQGLPPGPKSPRS